MHTHYHYQSFYKPSDSKLKTLGSVSSKHFSEDTLNQRPSNISNKVQIQKATLLQHNHSTQRLHSNANCSHSDFSRMLTRNIGCIQLPCLFGLSQTCMSLMISGFTLSRMTFNLGWSVFPPV